MVVQALNLLFTHEPRERYRLGIFGAAASLIIAIVIGVENWFLGSRQASIELYPSHIALTAVQLGVAAILSLTLLCLPRRPSVFHNGRPVDAQFTVSAFGRYTFSWASPVLAMARKNRGLSLDLLPYLAQYTRADFLQYRYNHETKKDRLWKGMLFNFRWVFLQQLTLVVLVSATQFAPQYAMLHILRLLEQRSDGAGVAAIAWAWVVGLGVAMLITSWIESWLFFVIYGDLGIPIRALLSILVFMKSTRRKDVKGVKGAKAVNDDDADTTDLVVNTSSGVKGEDTMAGEGSDEEDLQKSRQSTINLVAVDSKRVSDFCSYAYIFPGVATKLIVSMWFLQSLIGWRSLLAGLVTFALSTPVNVYVSRKYNNAQGQLMKLRDQKMAVVTEALQGIRQIKFSALERQWQAKIGEKRKQELDTQWSVFKYDTCLVAIWILGPVMLSAVSLTVYAILNGNLSPSIAFTTIAILSQIEGTLAIIPELTTDAVDAWVSINRIEEYLNAPEKADCTTPSDSVALENCSIAWPSDSQEEDPDRFILKDVNVRFPNKELSVISGKTGSGKSLMLAAILGEVDKISGTIKVPRAPPLKERFDHKATRGNWIIDAAIAL